MAHITEETTKMGKIPSVSLPAGISCGDENSKNFPKCYYEGCYARKISILRPTYAKRLAENFQEFQYNPRKYFHSIEGYLLYKSPLFFRWHVSGDIPAYNEKLYWENMVNLAHQYHIIHFLCFTKRYREYHEGSPRNLSIIWSHWPGIEMPPVPSNIGIAYLAGKDDVVEKGSECAGKCDKCTSCFIKEDRKIVYFKKH